MQLAFVLRILLKQIHFVSPINLIKLVLFSLFSRQDVLFLCGRDGKRVIQDSSFKRETAGLLTPGHFEAVDIVNDYQVMCLITQSCLTLCNPMDCSAPGFPVHHQLLELTQTYVHRVGDAIQPSHTLSFPSPPARIRVFTNE